MKRRSFPGLLLGAPIAAPIAAKAIASAAASPVVHASALEFTELNAITANFGGYANGVIASPDGSFKIDFTRGVMVIDENLIVDGTITAREMRVASLPHDLDLADTDWAADEPIA